MEEDNIQAKNKVATQTNQKTRLGVVIAVSLLMVVALGAGIFLALNLAK